AFVDARPEAGTSRLLGLGIAMPGPFGTMDGDDPWGMQDWQDFPLADWLTEKTGLVASVQNDAAAGAIAEKMYGAAKSIQARPTMPVRSAKWSRPRRAAAIRKRSSTTPRCWRCAGISRSIPG